MTGETEKYAGIVPMKSTTGRRSCCLVHELEQSLQRVFLSFQGICGVVTWKHVAILLLLCISFELKWELTEHHN
jgi:hypothetical protein